MNWHEKIHRAAEKFHRRDRDASTGRVRAPGKDRHVRAGLKEAGGKLRAALRRH